MKNIKLYNCDNLEVMRSMPDASVDIICIDPPYLYLKGQKLERSFDERLFFSECQRLLTDKGFIIMFGRGASFYRWNTILDELGMIFKEEIIWDKGNSTSPVLPISRIHETVSIHAKGKGSINRSKVPYLEMKAHDIQAIVQDIRRMRSILNNTKSLDAVLRYIENNEKFIDKYCIDKHTISKQPGVKQTDRSTAVLCCISNGMNEKTIIRSDFLKTETMTKSSVTVSKSSVGDGDRCVKVVNSIIGGMSEKTIIKQGRDHYSSFHPTQKPVRLIERLLSLVIPQDKPRDQIVVADWFGGSMSTMEAVYKMGMKGIATEIDPEYFEAGANRIYSLPDKQVEMFA